jgi:plasmid stability protein
VRQLITRIDDDLHRRLKERAAAEGRSVNALVTDVLERTVRGPVTRRSVRERARQLGLLVEMEAPDDVLPLDEVLELTRGWGTSVSEALEEERRAH